MSDPMWADDLAPHGVELRFERDHAHISLLGQVDLATGVALVDAATSAVARYERVELDLSGVTWIGDAGLRSLVKVRRFCDAHDARVAVVAASSVAAEALSESDAGAALGWTTSAHT